MPDRRTFHLAGVSDLRRSVEYGATLLGVALVYFALARLGLALASIHPSASPIWPPTGLALAAVLIWGHRVAPAIFAAALAANLLTAGSIFISTAVALGNTLEALVGGFLIGRWSGGRATFDSPAAIARFAFVCVALATPISATFGVASLTLAGSAPWEDFAAIWITWWMGDFAGALVITPAIVLWANAHTRAVAGRERMETAAVLAAAAVVGVIAFSPLFEQTANRSSLAFLALLPLLWAALRRGPRDTATVALLLSGFTVWGTLGGGGPFARPTLNESFLLLLAFMISACVPSLALSADVASHRRTEGELRRLHQELDQRVQRRTAALVQANRELEIEIEQRKHAEAELTQQSIHLVAAQRLANLGSWAWELPDGRVTWSDQLYAIYGLRREDFAGTFEDFLRRVHADDRDGLKAKVVAAYQAGTGFESEERIIRPDGEIRHLQSCGEVVRDESGRPLRMLGICQDVTERRKAEAALRESEQEYRLIVNSIRDYAIFMLGSNGEVASWNAGAERVHQYAAAEIVGRHFGAFYTEEDRARGAPEHALRAAAETGEYEVEGWRVRKDGSRFWANVTIDAIHDEDGKLIGFAKITRDETERRATQTALEQAREQLAQAQKMEALGQLTGGIAHDFNNLLMIVSGHAEVLRRRLSQAKDLRAVDAIQLAASRGERLTRQLLAFSRRQRLQPVVVDLRERIEALRDMLGRSLHENIELICEIEPGLWATEVDLSELELALVNIAINARDAMPKGGRITLSGRNVILRPGPESCGLEGEFVALAMTDSGSGIAPDIMPRIFEPFFTTKAVGKGTGLGLSQVYGFARQSGGAVTAASEVGRGTTITLYLPRSRAAAERRATTAKAIARTRAEGTVLLVEDNPDVADVTSSLLEQLGYRVAWAKCAEDALARLQNDDGFSLVLSDIVMPGEMNGIALARAIRERHPRLPVLLTSGYSDVLPSAEAQFPVLRKPFQLLQLEAALGVALADAAAAADGGAQDRGLDQR